MGYRNDLGKRCKTSFGACQLFWDIDSGSHLCDALRVVMVIVSFRNRPGQNIARPILFPVNPGSLESRQGSGVSVLPMTGGDSLPI